MNNKKRKKTHHVCAVPKIDNKPPRFDASGYLKAHDLQRDAVRVKQIDRENISLLKKINIIHRLGVSITIFYFIKKLIQFYIHYILKTNDLFLDIFLDIMKICSILFIFR